MKNIINKNFLFLSSALVASSLITVDAAKKIERRPNILFAIYDDMSFPYMSAYGCKSVKTPNFDRVAAKGQLFMNAYVTSPGSSPSRASILTGKYTWQIQEAGTHGSLFPKKFECYTDVFEQNGYKIGYTGKGWSPGNWKASRKRNPAGPEYNKILLNPPYTGIWAYDYSENFKECLSQRKENQPFCFWYGAKEAHRGYEKNSWKKDGKSLDEAVVPSFLPNSDAIKGDILDYAVEVEWADKQLGKMLDYLEEIGELENTFIVVTADNGMPFPAAKATCFESGGHVPMAICWGDKLKKSEPVEDLVSTIDLSATFFDVAGIKYHKKIDGKSMLPWLKGEKKKNVRQDILFGREHHADARAGGLGYPMRAMREGNYLYIYNYKPDRWPAGDPYTYVTKGGHKKIVPGYCDIDWSPSKEYIINNRKDKNVLKYFNHATAKKTMEELYDLSKDPECMNNLALSEDKKDLKILKSMHKKIFKYLKKSNDSRLSKNPDIWDTYPYFGKIREYPSPEDYPKE